MTKELKNIFYFFDFAQSGSGKSLINICLMRRDYFEIFLRIIKKWIVERSEWLFYIEEN